MERYTKSCRFILSCNYSSKIIEPIQSRCAIYRFKPVSDEAVEERIRYIASQEGLTVTDDGVDAIKYVAHGDMRRAINALQAAAMMSTRIDVDTIYQITATAHPERMVELIKVSLKGDFMAARSMLDDLLMEEGLSGEDVLAQLHRAVFEVNIPEKSKLQLMEKIGEVDFRLTEGANERIQLESLLAYFAIIGEG